MRSNSLGINLLEYVYTGTNFLLTSGRMNLAMPALCVGTVIYIYIYIYIYIHTYIHTDAYRLARCYLFLLHLRITKGGLFSGTLLEFVTFLVPLQQLSMLWHCRCIIALHRNIASHVLANQLFIKAIFIMLLFSLCFPFGTACTPRPVATVLICFGLLIIYFKQLWCVFLTM